MLRKDVPRGASDVRSGGSGRGKGSVTEAHSPPSLVKYPMQVIGIHMISEKGIRFCCHPIQTSRRGSTHTEKTPSDSPGTGFIYKRGGSLALRPRAQKKSFPQIWLGENQV